MPLSLFHLKELIRMNSAHTRLQ